MGRYNEDLVSLVPIILILGLIGTLEGYVPTPTDLYLRGQNIANFTRYTNYGFPVFDAGQLTFDSRK